jgi:hypothetical protein
LKPKGRNIDDNGCCKKCGGDRFREKKSKYIKQDGSESMSISFICVDCASKYKHERDLKNRKISLRSCKHCGIEFTPVNWQQVFCTEKCNMKWWYRNTIRQRHKAVQRISNRMHHAVRGAKRPKTLDVIGCTVDELRNYLQKTAIDNGYTDFNIDNYSGKEYHIDHIIPCCRFNLLDEHELRKCFHYTNLQILSAEENFAKSGRAA